MVEVITYTLIIALVLLAPIYLYILLRLIVHAVFKSYFEAKAEYENLQPIKETISDGTQERQT